LGEVCGPESLPLGFDFAFAAFEPLPKEEDGFRKAVAPFGEAAFVDARFVVRAFPPAQACPEIRKSVRRSESERLDTGAEVSEVLRPLAQSFPHLVDLPSFLLCGSEFPFAGEKGFEADLFRFRLLFRLCASLPFFLELLPPFIDVAKLVLGAFEAFSGTFSARNDFLEELPRFAKLPEAKGEFDEAAAVAFPVRAVRVYGA